MPHISHVPPMPLVLLCSLYPTMPYVLMLLCLLVFLMLLYSLLCSQYTSMNYILDIPLYMPSYVSYVPQSPHATPPIHPHPISLCSPFPCAPPMIAVCSYILYALYLHSHMYSYVQNVSPVPLCPLCPLSFLCPLFSKPLCSCYAVLPPSKTSVPHALYSLTILCMPLICSLWTSLGLLFPVPHVPLLSLSYILPVVP